MIGQVQIKNNRICRVTGVKHREDGYIDLDKFKEDRDAFETVLPTQETATNKAIKLKKHVDGNAPTCTQQNGECLERKGRSEYEEEYDNLDAATKKKISKEEYVSQNLQNPACKKYEISYSCSITEPTTGASLFKTYKENEYDASKVHDDFKKDATDAMNDAIDTYNTMVKNYATAIKEWNACSNGSILTTITNDLSNANVALDYQNVDQDGKVVYSYNNAYLASLGEVNDGKNTTLFGSGDSKNEEEDASKIGGQEGYDDSISLISQGYKKYVKNTGGTEETNKGLKYGTNIKWWQIDLKKHINFKLPINGYKYKTIPDGVYATEIPASQNYIDLGYTVMPVSMTTPRGKTYYYNLKVTSLGPVLTKKFNTKKKNHIESLDANNTCSYTVDCNDYIIDPKDPTLCIQVTDNYCADSNTPVPCGELKIIYRTISLNSGEAFPSINAEGRTPGDNWVGNEDYIYKNRGVKGYDVYKLDPMYEIDLTAVQIRKYRRYNRAANRTLGYSLNKKRGEYGIEGYSDFESMVCSVKNNGDYNCTSALLRGVTKYGEVNITNTDGDMIVRGCALKNGGNYTNCGKQSIVNNVAWGMNAAPSY